MKLRAKNAHFLRVDVKWIGTILKYLLASHERALQFAGGSCQSLTRTIIAELLAAGGKSRLKPFDRVNNDLRSDEACTRSQAVSAHRSRDREGEEQRRDAQRNRSARPVPDTGGSLVCIGSAPPTAPTRSSCRSEDPAHRHSRTRD